MLINTLDLSLIINKKNSLWPEKGDRKMLFNRMLYQNAVFPFSSSIPTLSPILSHVSIRMSCCFNRGNIPSRPPHRPHPRLLPLPHPPFYR